MAEITGIAWTDSTFNPWIGCTKVGPGCDNCYAEAQDKRFGGGHWGAGVERRLTSDAYWRKPFLWNERAGLQKKRHLVFCASQADVFDNEIDPKWRQSLFAVIDKTPHLTWQLLTKRIGNVRDMLEAMRREFMPSNVWLGATVVTQAEADRDMSKLVLVPAVTRFLSIEPQIEEINLRHPLGIDWVICGGESRQQGKCRPFDVGWAISLRNQCKAMNIPFFMKQLGHRAHSNELKIEYTGKGDNPLEWPESIRVRQFPHV